MEETMKSQKQDEIPSLPEELIADQILPRLPVKPLTRFKCVSNLWLDTISSPQFAESHLKLYSSPSSQFLLFPGDRDPRPRFTSVKFDEHSEVNEVVNFEFTCDAGSIDVVGSCRGLVCFCDQNFKFCLWNPITRQYNYDVSGPDCPDYVPKNVLAVGFGYVSSIDDYRITCLLKKSSSEIGFCSVYVFSLRAGTWDEMANLDIEGVEFARASESVFVSDTVYWCAKDTNLVFGVNLVNGQLTKIPIISPNTLYHPTANMVRLFRMKGRLSLYYYCSNQNIEVWMLRRDGSSWMKLFHLYGLVPLLVAESGRCLIHRRGQLMLLDPSQIFLGLFQGGMYLKGSVSSALEYEENLISPFGPNVV